MEAKSPKRRSTKSDSDKPKASRKIVFNDKNDDTEQVSVKTNRIVRDKLVNKPRSRSGFMTAKGVKVPGTDVSDKNNAQKGKSKLLDPCFRNVW